MSVEIIWLGTAAPSTETLPRCRFCARVLTAYATEPGEVEAHCTSRGCRYCVECATGRTSVSPVRRHRGGRHRR
jgi:hypothetical protein